MDEMRRLDEILSAKICTEKQVKRQRKELQAKLWQEFLVDTFVAFTPRTPPVHCSITVICHSVKVVSFCSRINLKVTLRVHKKQ